MGMDDDAVVLGHQHACYTCCKAVQNSRKLCYCLLSVVSGACSWRLLQTNIVLSGPNKIVHIDESLFGHEQNESKIAFGMLCHN